MFVTSTIARSVSKIIDGEWKTFIFLPGEEIELPDTFGAALIKTYPEIHAEAEQPTLLPIPVEEPKKNFSEEPAKEKPKKLGSKKRK